MLSTAKLTANDPHDVLEIAPDVVLAAHADRAPPAPERTSLAPDLPADPASLSAAASAPRLDATLRAAAADRARLPAERGRWAMRFFIGFLFAVCSAVGAAAWQTYGDEAQETITKWMPHFGLGLSSPAQNAADAEQPAAPVAETAAATPAPAQAAPPAQAEAAAPTTAAAAASPDTTQLLQSMARDLANVGQQIEQMKAGIDELRARQEQMSREIAKASEQNAKPRVAAPAVPPAAAHAARAAPTQPAMHRPVPPRQSAAAPYVPPPAAAPYVAPPPPEPTVDAQGEPVVRPPMPLR